MAELRPFEVMFADEKEYDCLQRGGVKTTLMIYDMASDGWFIFDEYRKTDHGDWFRAMVAEHQIQLLRWK